MKNRIEFPENVPDIVSLEHFKSVETFTQTSLWLYQRYRENGKYNIRLLRRGRILDCKMSEEERNKRTVFLVCLEDRSHVFLVQNLSKYLRSVRKGAYNAKREFCHSCMSSFPTEKLNSHLEFCVQNRGVSVEEYPPEGSFYKFNSHHALELAPYIAVYDTEAMLPPKKEGLKGVLNEHKFLCYSYVILHKNGKVVHYGDGTDMTCMIIEMCDKYRKLMNKYRKNLEKKATLTPQEEQEFLESTNCFICEESIVGKDRHRHHCHDKKTLYDDDGEILQSNYVGAACFRCNSRITAKRSLMPVFGHNSMRYDNHFALKGIPKNYETSFVIKSEEQFLEMRVRPPRAKNAKLGEQLNCGLSFLDSFHNMSTGLQN